LEDEEMGAFARNTAVEENDSRCCGSLGRLANGAMKVIEEAIYGHGNDTSDFWLAS
jgi:hypothetical protein